jgi:hypothetical protein
VLDVLRRSPVPPPPADAGGRMNSITRCPKDWRAPVGCGVAPVVGVFALDFVSAMLVAPGDDGIIVNKRILRASAARRPGVMRSN